MPGADFISDVKSQARTFAAEILAGSELLTKEASEIAELETAQMAEASEDILATNETLANPLAGAFASKQENIKKHMITRTTAPSKPEEKQKIVPEREAKDAASKFEKRNPELRAGTLVNLLKKAQDCKTKDELLKLIEEYYPDPLLADEALDFLAQNSLGDFKEIVLAAKDEFSKKFERDIRAEKNIAQEVSRFAGKDIEVRPKLRQRYLELIHTSAERGASEIFLDYGKQFPTYKELRRIFAYFYRALGMDLKAQGPAIEKGFLHSLMQEVRKAQSGIGLYNFFRDRLALMQKEFTRNGLSFPEGLTFEKMTESFLELLSERYPSLEKVFEHIPFSKTLNILGKIITCNQFRDAMPQTSMAFLFRSEQHKEELRKSILDALEKLEEELEENEDKNWENEDAFDPSVG